MTRNDYRKRFIKLIIALKTEQGKNKEFSVELSSFINAFYRKFPKDEMARAIFNALHPYLNKEKRNEIQISANLEENLNSLIGGIKNELYNK